MNEIDTFEFNPPFIYGEFTDWKAVKMFDIRNFCHLINRDKLDVFQHCKDIGLISQNKKFENLNEK